MPAEPITQSAPGIDLSARVVDTTAVVASPAAAAETIITSLTIPAFGAEQVVQKIYLDGWAALTVGTSGTAVTLRIRETNASGTVVATTGALTAGIAAAKLAAQGISGSDATPGVGVYVLTAQVTNGAAESTVSAVSLRALVV
jgi:hypothetical protein